jgi:cytochrome c-type biogenesis protein CcmH
MSHLLVTLITVVVLGAPGAGHAQHPATPVNEREVHEIATKLRCVVCQNLSVADSPSEMANQMRAVVRERLAAGERPEQVIQYFVDKYGAWILLEPRSQGFTLLVWVLPPLALAVGLATAVVLITRWTRRSRAALPSQPVDPGMRERIRREMEQQP